jgi:hypothetical protein
MNYKKTRMRPTTGKRVQADTVVDEQGRRRFHGAFTGGFSAGFYNTVGSEEGWKPQTFASGRNSKGEFKQQSVHDFADDEDGLLGSQLLMNDNFNSAILPNASSVTTSKIYPQDSSSAHRSEQLHSNSPIVSNNKFMSKSSGYSIPGAIINEFIIANNKTIGMKLLQTMGWRHGHGIGARNVMTDIPEGIDKNMLPTSAFDVLTNTLTKAPEDFSITIPVPKADVLGLGCIRQNSHAQLSHPLMRKSAYYISDLYNGGNQEDGFMHDDEEDTYHSTTRSTHYHDELSPEEVIIDNDEENLLHLTGKEPISSWIIQKSNNQGVGRVCMSDGRPPLEGFILAEALKNMNLDHPVIPMPDDYSPAKTLFQIVLRKPKVSRFDTSTTAPAPATDSVFALLGDEGRNKIKRAIEERAWDMKSGKEPSVTIESNRTEEVPVLDLRAERPELMSESHKNRFSGLSEAFKNRFTTASSSLSTAASNGDKQVSGLTTASEFASKLGEVRLLESEVLASSRDSRPVLKGGRTTSMWAPMPLLCKRFNVPVPVHAQQQPSVATDLRDRGEKLFEEHIGAYVDNDRSVIAIEEKASQVEALETNSLLVNGAPDILVNVAMTVIDRPSLSMLKSIFDSDSEEEDDGDENDSLEEHAQVSTSVSSVDIAKSTSCVELDESVLSTDVYLKRKYLNSNDSTCLQSEAIPPIQSIVAESFDSDTRLLFKKPNRPKRPDENDADSNVPQPVSKVRPKVKIQKSSLSFTFDDN